MFTEIEEKKNIAHFLLDKRKNRQIDKQVNIERERIIGKEINIIIKIDILKQDRQIKRRLRDRKIDRLKERQIDRQIDRKVDSEIDR